MSTTQSEFKEISKKLEEIITELEAASDKCNLDPMQNKFCHACKSQLNEGAIRCKECGAFQGARRWWNMLNDYVSPIGTMVALLGVASAMWVSILRPNNAEIKGLYLDRGEGLTFIFENTGESSAILLNASVRFPYKEGRRWRGGRQSVAHLAERIIETEATLEVRYFELESLPSEVEEVLEVGEVEKILAGFSREEICVFQFVYGEIDGTNHDVRVNFPCWHFAVHVRK